MTTNNALGDGRITLGRCRITLGRCRITLARVAAFAVLVVLPLAMLSAHLAAVLGPMHVHDGGVRVAETGTHDHQHTLFERHRHAADDRSVILVEPDPLEADGAAAGSVRSLPLGPLAQQLDATLAPRTDACPRAALSRWCDPAPARPERPPRRA